jgi:hypothetical protein
MLALAIVLACLVALDAAALRWGVDSKEEPDGPERMRRSEW